MRRAKRRLPDWLIGTAVTLMILALAWVRPAFLETLEARLFDFRLKWFGPAAPAQTIAIVAIDEESITKLGRWPWPRTRIAALVEKLAARGAKVIGLSLILSEPEEQSGLQTLRTVEEQFQALGPVKGGPEFLQKVQELKASLDHDAALVAAVRAAGNVVLPSFAALQGAQSPGPSGQGGLPEFAAKSLVTSLRQAESAVPGAPPRALEMTWPLDALGAAAAAVGHINRLPDADGISRWEPLLIEYREQYLPHFALAVAAKGQGIPRERIQAVFGEGMRLGALHIPTDDRMRLLLTYYGGGRTFPHYSAYDVLNDKIAASAFQGKIVLIGATAPGIGDVEATPLDPVFPGVEKHAHLIANVQEGRFLARPLWAGLYELAATLAAGVIAAVVLPQVGAGLGAATGALLFVAVVAAAMVSFAASGILLGATAPALAVLATYTAISSRRFLMVEREKAAVEEESDEAKKLLGLTFQEKGMLDLAWDKLGKLPVDEEMKGVLYNLALDYERKRQPAKALTVYERIAAADRAFRDVAERMKKTQAAAAAGTVVQVGGPRRGESTQIVEGVERPTLGRYQLVEELGRGAMGIVYRGLDPKINRQVAIKTAHFEGVEEALLPQVKERFLREAQAAGGLNHPNILTIYDSGEEQDLAWIAMEFLQGKDLERSCAPGSLLPWSKVLEICAKVADALGYAHAHGVVHRDIKPANIMLLDSGEVKVTDFGIARLVASSQTKTGSVLGTPSYMSPEQLAGKKVDGRSDLFSLGVVLYELLAGARPFEGEEITTIMYNIANSPPPPLVERVPKLPPIFQKLVEKALAKDPAQRFQTGEEFAKTLRALKERLDKALATGMRSTATQPPRPTGTSTTPGAATTQQLQPPPGG